MEKAQLMPNWERTPPVAGMSVEEIKRRVADGLKRRRQTGELRPEGLKDIELKPGTIVDGQFQPGPSMNRKQRRVMIHASELAIYALANGNREDYCGACEAMNAVRRQAGFPTRLMQSLLSGVAAQAAELRGEPVEIIDQLARRWLHEHYQPSGKTISIPKGQSDGGSKP